MESKALEKSSWTNNASSSRPALCCAMCFTMYNASGRPEPRTEPKQQAGTGQRFMTRKVASRAASFARTSPHTMGRKSEACSTQANFGNKMAQPWPRAGFAESRLLNKEFNITVRVHKPKETETKARSNSTLIFEIPVVLPVLSW